VEKSLLKHSVNGEYIAMYPLNCHSLTCMSSLHEASKPGMQGFQTTKLTSCNHNYRLARIKSTVSYLLRQRQEVLPFRADLRLIIKL
jgi:hypothetical protein